MELLSTFFGARWKMRIENFFAPVVNFTGRLTARKLKSRFIPFSNTITVMTDHAIALQVWHIPWPNALILAVG
jgi:hypothetical protein